MTLEPHPHHRRLSTCHRHPAEPFTGVCASCLRDRLAGFDPATRLEISVSPRVNDSGGVPLQRVANRASCPLEFRRCKSLSAGKCEVLPGSSEQRRKSCDVGVRSTLCDLFTLDDERNGSNREKFQVESRNLGFQRITAPVLESREEEENEEEIRGFEEVLASDVNVIDKGIEEFEDNEEVKTMKEHIDLEWKNRKPNVRDFKDIAGSFWLAASVFSKKLRKWRQKQKMKQPSGSGHSLEAMEVEKPIGKQIRETQSEIADYGLGRRSCDTDPRFSMDAGRISVDAPRYSFDEARASWDGYLMGRMVPRLPPMVSVVEDVNMEACRSGNRGMVVEEQMNSINEDEMTSGGSAQTRDCSDSSSSQSRRRSFDCSSSSRKGAGPEADEMKSVPDAKVSPATVDVFHGLRLLLTERGLRDSHLNSLKDDQSEVIESVSKNAASASVAGTCSRNGFRKSRQWCKVWNIWSSVHRRGDGKCEDKSGYFRGTVADQPVVETWERMGREVNGAANHKLTRSHSSSSSKSSFNMAGSFQGMKGGAESKGHVSKRREEFVLERNRSARYSPNNLDNGLLRFYLTPLRTSRRSKSGQSRLKNSPSIAGSVLKLY